MELRSKTYPNERLEAEAIINEYLNGMKPPYDGWHHIDNAHNDLLREIIKQLIRRLVNAKNTKNTMLPKK